MTREIRTDAGGHGFVVPTIAELAAQGRPLEIRCFHPDCRRVVLIPAVEAATQRGRTLTIEAADRRLVCRACGARGCDGFVQARFVPPAPGGR